jgi:membrane-associated protease RseP (regulator of RpoE activity)
MERKMFCMRNGKALLVVLVLSLACFFVGRAFAENAGMTDNFVEQQKAGVGLQMVDKKIVVKGLAPNSPAEKAGIKSGDVILTVDGISFPGIKEIVDHVATKRKGEHVVFVVERGGEKRTFELEPMTLKIRQTLASIQSLVLDNEKVVLAVVVSDVKSTFEMKPDVYTSWAEGVRNEEQTSMESFYLNNLGKNHNFSIVDRSRTQTILEEFKMGQTGLVSDTMRAKIGEMTGATHLLDVSFSRFRTTQGYDDVVNARLIDIASGTVMAVDQMRFMHKKGK